MHFSAQDGSSNSKDALLIKYFSTTKLKAFAGSRWTVAAAAAMLKLMLDASHAVPLVDVTFFVVVVRFKRCRVSSDLSIFIKGTDTCIRMTSLKLCRKKNYTSIRLHLKSDYSYDVQ